MFSVCRIADYEVLNRPISSYSDGALRIWSYLHHEETKPYNHKAILHENCHSSPTDRIICLYPNYVALMSMHCMLRELELDILLFLFHYYHHLWQCW